MKVKLKIHLITVSFLFITLIPFSAFAIDGQIKISQPASQEGFPIQINKPGSYVLTSNLVVTDPSKNAIYIMVNDVTLDLNGFTIQGPGPNGPLGSGSGVVAFNRYNIVIRNGRVWGFKGEGIFLNNEAFNPSFKGAGSRIENIQAVNNGGSGIIAISSLVINCVANNNRGSFIDDAGIDVRNSIVKNCTASNNAGDGIIALESSIFYSSAHYNANSGIEIYWRGFIEGNNMRNNNEYGLEVTWGTEINDTFAVKNTASDNGSGNFYITSGNYIPTTGDNANYGF